MEAAGIDYEMVHYSPNEGVERWIKIITEKRWDGIGIGSAVRGAFPQLAEDLINAIIERSPHSKVFFNKTPGDAYETAKRLLPDI